MVVPSASEPLLWIAAGSSALSLGSAWMADTTSALGMSVDPDEPPVEDEDPPEDGAAALPALPDDEDELQAASSATALAAATRPARRWRARCPSVVTTDPFEEADPDGRAWW